MANFIVKTSKYHIWDKDSYQAKINDIVDVGASDQQPLLLQKFDSDLRHHPHLWSKSNRTGASNVSVHVQGNHNKSLYEYAEEKLKSELKDTVYFSGERKVIKQKLTDLKLLQQEENEKFLESLKNDTADFLLAYINKRMLVEESIVSRIKEIKKLTAKDLTTASNSLKYTKEVNALRNDLLKMSANYALPNLSDFNHAARQLSVVTKLWIDPFYEKPQTLSNAEKARQIVKLISVNLAALFALAAIVSTFVFPPAAIIFGLASMVGMWPLVDLIIEVGRNAWHGRSPTKAQAIELGIFSAMVVVLMFGANALAPVGSAIMNTAPKIGQAFVTIGTFIATKFMNYFNVSMNILGSIGNGVAVKKSFNKSSTSSMLTGMGADSNRSKITTQVQNHDAQPDSNSLEAKQVVDAVLPNNDNRSLGFGNR